MTVPSGPNVTIVMIYDKFKCTFFVLCIMAAVVTVGKLMVSSIVTMKCVSVVVMKFR